MFVVITKGKYEGKIVEVVERTENGVCFGNGSLLLEVPEGHYRYLGENYNGSEIPEAFDVNDSMSIPESISNMGDHIGCDCCEDDVHTVIEEEFDGWEEDPRTIAMARDNDQVRAELKALKQRMEREAERMEKAIAEQMKTIQELTAERDEYKGLNEFHRKEVDTGNVRRAKMKETVASLHEEIRTERKARQEETIRANEASEQLKRLNRLIDKILK